MTAYEGSNKLLNPDAREAWWRFKPRCGRAPASATLGSYGRLSDYQLFAAGQLAITLFFPVIAAVAYYVKAPGSDAKQRVSFILHSIALMLAAVYAVLVAPWSGGQSEIFIWPFYFLLIAFLVGLIYTLRQYTGPRDLHFFQLLQIPSAVWVWLAGTMTITHDWL